MKQLVRGHERFVPNYPECWGGVMGARSSPNVLIIIFDGPTIATPISAPSKTMDGISPALLTLKIFNMDQFFVPYPIFQ